MASMTFDECIKQANAGKVCQMMAPNGKWVKFDPKKVINKFRIAPELTPNDGLKVRERQGEDQCLNELSF